MILPIDEFARNGFNARDGQAADSGGDAFANTGQELVIIDNTTGSPVTITFVTSAIADDLPVPDKTLVVPANKTYIIGPFPGQWYTDSIGLTYINYSLATGIFMRVVRPTGLRPLL